MASTRPTTQQQRPLLADVTDKSISRRNVEAKHEDDQQQDHRQHHHKKQAGGSQQQPAQGDDMSYFAAQYQSAALAESIRAHQEHVKGGKRSSPAPAVDAPTTAPAEAPVQDEQQTPPRSRPPAKRNGTTAGPSKRTPKEKRHGQQAPSGAGSFNDGHHGHHGGMMAAHPNHEDIDGYPCPCPDCGMRRLAEVHQTSNAAADDLQQPHVVPPPQQQRFRGGATARLGGHVHPMDAATMQQEPQFHPEHHQQQRHHVRMDMGAHPASYMSHDGVAYPTPHHHAHQMYEDAYAQHPQQQQHRRRQNSPYGGATSGRSGRSPVGYSPDNGFYNLPPSMPQSPYMAGPAGPTYEDAMMNGGGHGYHQAQHHGPMTDDASHHAMGSDFDVPYIPAPRVDYSRFANAESPNSSEGEAAAGGKKSFAPTVSSDPLPRRATNPRHAPPQPKRKIREPVSLSPPEPRSPVTTAPVPPAVDHQHTRSVKVSAAPGSLRGQGPARGDAIPAEGVAQPQPLQQVAPKSTQQRRASPTSTTASTAQRPPCPYALKVRASPWHTRTVLSPSAFAEGSYVVHEGDRGTDAGVVVSCSASAVDATGPQGRQLPLVISTATSDDVERIESADSDGVAAVEPARALVEKLQLPMRVIGAAYQHDRQKLTFIYEASERVDFRSLLRELYTEFRCRIWMEVPPGAHNPTSSPSTGASTAAGGHAAERRGNHHRRGTSPTNGPPLAKSSKANADA